MIFFDTLLKLLSFGFGVSTEILPAELFIKFLLLGVSSKSFWLNLTGIFLVLRLYVNFEGVFFDLFFTPSN